ncbi:MULTISPECIES: citrate:proton symporter [Brevibacterium]|uniref:CitMHS family transporter n=1 Tax=Brevibacterium salitolerans TaxID=1403566 RepID=A0ABN2WHE2_9MICO|nr:citrate:proton symporter [Brevibacterium sp.]
MPELTEPDVLLTTVGLLSIAATVGLLIWGKVSPVVAMVVVPLVGALVTGASFTDLQEWFDGGLVSVMSVVVMFIFAIIYFGILSDAGLFDPVIRGLILATRGRVVLVTVGTVLIGAIAHLDGAGATTFLLTIPALLPLYNALGMSRYLLLLLLALSASIMNMVPWGGPLARTATTTGIDPAELYRELLPVQGVAMVLLLCLAVLLGLREKKRVAAHAGVAAGSGPVDVKQIAEDFTARQLASREEVRRDIAGGRVVYWANVVLTVALLTVMLGGWLSPALTFLTGVALALPLNFRTAKAQMDRIKVYAPNALMMAAVIIAAAVFLGVLRDSGMLESIALSLLAVIPSGVGSYLHVIVGFLGVPLDIMTSTDAYYFSVLPLVDATAGQFGVATTSTAFALLLGNIIGTFVSPFSPALWLALGLAEANMGKHLKYSFFITWAFSIVLLLIAILMGVVQV